MPSFLTLTEIGQMSRKKVQLAKHSLQFFPLVQLPLKVIVKLWNSGDNDLFDFCIDLWVGVGRNCRTENSVV